jgi:hypothetical protein
MLRRAFVGLAMAAGLSACGYQVVHYAEALGDVRTVAIQGLSNETLEPGIDSVVSDALAREFLRRGALRLVGDPERADLVISGSVARLGVARKSFSSISLALEYELTLVLELHATRRDGTRVPIDGAALSESERYVASADVEVERTHREEAIRRLAGLLAGRIHDALFERVAP